MTVTETIGRFPKSSVRPTYIEYKSESDVSSWFRRMSGVVGRLVGRLQPPVENVEFVEIAYPMTRPNIAFVLTADQADLMRPIVRRQPTERRNLFLIGSVAPHLDDGQPTLHFQSVFVRYRTAEKILRLIRNEVKL